MLLAMRCQTEMHFNICVDLCLRLTVRKFRRLIRNFISAAWVCSVICFSRFSSAIWFFLNMTTLIDLRFIVISFEHVDELKSAYMMLIIVGGDL